MGGTSRCSGCKIPRSEHSFGKPGKNCPGPAQDFNHSSEEHVEDTAPSSETTPVEGVSVQDTLAQGGLAATFDLAAFGLYMIAPVKKSVNHSKTLTSMREVQRSLARTTARPTNICFFVRVDSIVENEFVFCYCLFAASILGGSTEFEHHISLNSGSVYTPAVYYVKKMSGDGCAIENINARGVNSHLTWEKALVAAFDLPYLDPFLFLRPSKSME